MKKISVIIPVYNAEKYITRCIESIASQVFNDFEVICINDGSSDGSSIILKSLSEKFPFLRVINQENKGASAARNTGLDNAHSDYVCFVDADDWLEPEYLLTLYSDIIENKADLSMIGINKVENDVITPIFLYSTKKTFSKPDEINMLQAGCFCNNITDFETNFIGMGTPWDKLFNLQIINSNKLRFNPNLKTGEDTLFCWNYFNYVQKFVYHNVSLYNYVVYTNSLSRKYVELDDFYTTAKTFSELFNNDLPEISKNSLYYVIFRHFLSLLKKHFYINKYKVSFHAYKKEMKEVLSSEYMKFSRKNVPVKILSTKEKIILKLMNWPGLLSILLFILSKKN